MRSIKDEPDITSRTIEQQLKMLFREPLARLARDETQPKPLIFVVDALDECGDDASRPKMADSLCQIATLTNWLKIFVTSRPTDELMWKFSSFNAQIISVDLNVAETASDIKLYTRHSMEKLVSESGLSSTWVNEDTIQRLTALASGLFIWTRTMINYVRGEDDKEEAMKIILDGAVGDPDATLGLDKLYTTVIENSGSGKKKINLRKKILGVVCITAKNRPQIGRAHV